MDFFQTKQYKTFRFISARMKDKNTGRNQIKLLASYLLCIRLAKQKFNDYGFNETTGKYDWENGYTYGWAEQDKSNGIVQYMWHKKESRIKNKKVKVIKDERIISRYKDTVLLEIASTDSRF